MRDVFETLRTRKVKQPGPISVPAVFCIGMQLFQQLYYQADFVYGGRLPVHVHFLMDEFANVALPTDFDKLLSTMRSREISVSIIIQNIAQLKVLFKDGAWENVRGNCDTLLYLGGNEYSTHEMISKMLGKETIDTNTYGHSKGRNGSYSKNDQNTGRELMTMDEVSLLDNRYAILFIRGFRPIYDRKYPLMKHPNIRYCADGDAPVYQHGVCTKGDTFDTKELLRQAEPMGQTEYCRMDVYADEQMEDFYGQNMPA